MKRENFDRANILYTQLETLKDQIAKLVDALGSKDATNKDLAERGILNDHNNNAYYALRLNEYSDGSGKLQVTLTGLPDLNSKILRNTLSLMEEHAASIQKEIDSL